MTRIYLIRHADVENPKRVIYGRLGFFRISELGKRQVADLHKFFKDKNLFAIYASPLLRARQTAKGISGGLIPIHYSNNLLEANYAKWEGKPWNERPKKDMELYLNTPTKLQAGETLEQIQKRIIAEIERLVKKHPGKNIAVVSHADPISVARLTFEEKSLDLVTKNRIRKASLTILDFDKDGKCTKVDYKEVTDSLEEQP